MQREPVRGIAVLSLLLVALWTCGCHGKPKPGGVVEITVTTSPIRFHDVAQTAGLSYRWGHKSRSGLNILDTIGHGCAFLDYDGDGKLDILLVGNDHCLLYRNRGDGTFEEVTERAFPGAPRRPSLLGCAVADYDGDGRPDIFVTGYGRTILYHNEGNGSFRDVTHGSGLEARGDDDWTTSAAWADVDGDGRLDLYVCRYIRFNRKIQPLCPYLEPDGGSVLMACSPVNYPPEKGSLYHNEGGGHFRDVTTACGLGDAQGNALACMFCDFNGDGKPDLFIANDQRTSDLYVNTGRGKFTNRGTEAGVAYNADAVWPSGMGIDWGDYDGDGRFDLLVSDFSAQPKSLFHNEGGEHFTQASRSSGLGPTTLHALTFGAAFVDADNEGRLDIVLTNGHVLSEIEKQDRQQTYAQPTRILHNLGGRFEDISANAGSDVNRALVGRGIAIGDYDGDGRQDLLLVDDEGGPLLLHNDSPLRSHWISLRCERTPHGSPAIGALVTLSAGGRKQIAEVRASGSYLSTNAPDVHFGLGPQTVIDEIQVRWPNGRLSRFTAIAADHIYGISPNDTTVTKRD